MTLSENTLSQRMITKKCGVSQSTVSKIIKFFTIEMNVALFLQGEEATMAGNELQLQKMCIY